MEEQEYGLSLKDMLNALKRRLVWIIIIPIIAAIAVGVYVKTATVDMYSAQVKLYTLFDYVDATGTVRYDLSSSSYFASDYKELIRTNDVLSEVSRRMGWNGWPSGMSISVSAVTDTRLMNLQVTSPDPQMSMEAANTLAAVFIEYTRNLMQQDSIRIASEATLPGNPSNGGREKYILLALLGAMAAVMGIVIGLEMLNTKVRADGNADVRLHVNVLSSITGYK